MLEVVEIAGRSEQGMTQPYICRCNDDNWYFVKGKDAGRSSQIYEWIAGNLALALDLPIAPFSQVLVDDSFSNVSEYRAIGKGMAFGSQKLGVTEVLLSQLAAIPDAQQQDLLLFDWWIKNIDRTLSANGGNPNLFWEPTDAKLVVIDHNQAFDESFSKNDFLNCHIFKQQKSAVFEDFVNRDIFQQKIDQAMGRFDNITCQIPPAWWYADEECSVPAQVLSLEQIKAILNQYKTENFWTTS